MKLDPSRPYSKVYGDPKVRFEQDGHQFDWKGEDLEDPAPMNQSERMKQIWAKRKSATT